jgi:hypothetical protein
LIGVARADITPPVGIYARNWGAAEHDTAQGVHRPLTLTVLTLRAADGGDPMVLASADLGWWRRAEDEAFVRGGVLEALNLDPSRVALCLTHTHSGPSLCREDADRPGGELVGPYLDWLRETLVYVTRAALAKEGCGTLDWTYGLCDLATQRDLPDPAGSGRFVTGFHPGATADTTLLVGRMLGEAGGATVVNYACHPTTLAWENRHLSPDFVGAMREQVMPSTLGEVLFIQGASGELAPRDQYTGDTDAVDRNGSRLAQAVELAESGMLPRGHRLEYRGVVESGAPLAVWEKVKAASAPESLPLAAHTVHVPLPLKADLPTAAEIAARLDAATDTFERERLRRARMLRQSQGDGDTWTLPLTVWRMGGAAFVGVPGEAYSLLQRELRAAFPDQAVMVSNVCNGWVGYLPPAHLYGKDLYPVWQTPLAEGCLEKVIEAAKDALREVFAPAGTKVDV